MQSNTSVEPMRRRRPKGNDDYTGEYVDLPTRRANQRQDDLVRFESRRGITQLENMLGEV